MNRSWAYPTMLQNQKREVLCHLLNYPDAHWWYVPPPTRLATFPSCTSSDFVAQPSLLPLFARGESTNYLIPDPLLISKLLTTLCGSFTGPNDASLSSIPPLPLSIFVFFSTSVHNIWHTPPLDSPYCSPGESSTTDLPKGSAVIPPTPI